MTTTGLWPIVRVKGLYRPVDVRAGSRAADLPLISVSIHRGAEIRGEWTDDESRADSLENYKVCAQGDVVLNRMRAFQGAVGISPANGLVSPDYLVMRPDSHVENRFLHHLFRSRWFVGEMISRLRGIGSVDLGNVRTPRINREDLDDIRVALPSSAEQRRIADFLDDQVGTLDRLAQERAAQLSTLEISLRNFAHDAVTGRGRDDLIETDLPWAQGLPASWLIAKLSLIARMGTGHTPSRSQPDHWLNCSIPWITTGDVHRFRHDEIETLDATANQISELGLRNSAAVIHPAGTVALSRTASAGFSVVMGREMATSQDFVTWTCGSRLDP
jgi:type I restriction enzyme S subunit